MTIAFEWYNVLFLLIAAHALADFSLQNDAMGAGKNRHNKMQEKKGPMFPQWYYWMSAHTLIHGGFVMIITGSMLLGVIETLIHWIIDFAKCEGWIDLKTDQLLHLLCKALYCYWLFAADEWFSSVVTAVEHVLSF